METPIGPAPPYPGTDEPNTRTLFDNEDLADPDDSDNDVDKARALEHAAARANDFKILRENVLQTLALYLMRSDTANRDAITTRLASLATDVASKGTLSALQTKTTRLQLEFLELQRKETSDPDLEFEKKLGDLIASGIFVRSRDGSTALTIQSREQARSTAPEVDQKAELHDRANTAAKLWLSKQVKLGLDIIKDRHPHTAPPSFSQVTSLVRPG